jgi:hypothetical protein
MTNSRRRNSPATSARGQEGFEEICGILGVAEDTTPLELA